MRSKEADIVILSKSDYESMQETIYLLGNPVNAARLARGIAEFEAGKATGALGLNHNGCSVFEYWMGRLFVLATNG